MSDIDFSSLDPEELEEILIQENASETVGVFKIQEAIRTMADIVEEIDEGPVYAICHRIFEDSQFIASEREHIVEAYAPNEDVMQMIVKRYDEVVVPALSEQISIGELEFNACGFFSRNMPPSPELDSLLIFSDREILSPTYYGDATSVLKKPRAREIYVSTIYDTVEKAIK